MQTVRKLSRPSVTEPAPSAPSWAVTTYFSSWIRRVSTTPAYRSRDSERDGSQSGPLWIEWPREDVVPLRQTQGYHDLSNGITIDRPRSLVATVVERLRQAIIDAELALGSELSEAGLASMLGVSRTPIREALTILQQQGMVNIIPQRGTYVFFPTEQDIIDLCEYRIVLESRAISFAMARHRDETTMQLERALDMMDRARADGDPVAYSRADTVFHEAFIRNCRNRYLQEGFEQVAGQIATLRTHLSVPIAGAQDRSYVHHREIVEAFKNGDILAIDAVLTDHILSTRKSYIEAMQEGLIKPPAAAVRVPAGLGRFSS
ncbi:GntR family transcriptional regulator [Mesorhizobium sp. B2-7-2]|nr:GntR family transcriptional regulator [Mesorhizobium sp. B2-7-2]TPJ79170.1 GntR family transcriptional regulator [Mesorhizobium sp. B2-6-2]